MVEVQSWCGGVVGVCLGKAQRRSRSKVGVVSLYLLRVIRLVLKRRGVSWRVMRQKAWRAGYCGSSHSPVAAVLRHLHRPAPLGQLGLQPFSVRAAHPVSHLFAVTFSLSLCFAVAWLLLCLVYVLRLPALVEMTWLEGLKVGYEEGISERVGGVVC